MFLNGLFLRLKLPEVYSGFQSTSKIKLIVAIVKGTVTCFILVMTRVSGHCESYHQPLFTEYIRCPDDTKVLITELFFIKKNAPCVGKTNNRSAWINGRLCCKPKLKGHAQILAVFIVKISRYKYCECTCIHVTRSPIPAY